MEEVQFSASWRGVTVDLNPPRLAAAEASSKWPVMESASSSSAKVTFIIDFF